MKQQFLAKTSDTFKTYIYENNRKVVPASASVTVHAPGGGVLINGSAMSIASDGLLSYSLSPADNDLAGVNYKAVVEYLHNSKTCYATLFYDVVNSRLTKVITDDDIVTELPQLKDNGWRVRGSASGGSVSTIVDVELKRHEDDYFTGGLAYLPGRDETREVLGFSSATGTVSTADFSTAVAAGEKYILTRSFSREIQRAFEKIEDRLIRLGRRPHLVLDPYDLREAHIFFSVAEACKGLISGSQGFWREMWKEYEKKAEDAFAGISLKYDSTGDGQISGSEVALLNNVKAGRR